MFSILKKREAQAQQLAQQQSEPVKAPVHNVAVHQETQSRLIEKPWQDIQAMLKQDISYLRTLAGSQEKDPYKQELVSKYRPLVEKLLITHDNLNKLDVVWYFYQWQVDLCLLEQVHDAFRAAIAKGLETPDNWKSNGQTAYCDMVFKYSHNAFANNAPFKRDYLQNAVSDLQQGVLATNAPLKVKMFRLVGNWHYDQGEQKQAHDLFEQVMKLDPKRGGCKTKLKELKQELGYDDPH